MNPFTSMPKLTYVNVFIDLHLGLDERFKKIKCRTEIRMAQKSGVTTAVLSGEKDSATIVSCEQLLRALLKRKLVPFPPLFRTMLADPKNWLLVAKKDDRIISFALLNPEKSDTGPLREQRVARLEVMATDDAYKRLCPNYLVIWDAITFLKKEGFDAMIWGFSHYLNVPDPDFESVRFYKEKWHISSFNVTTEASWARYLYFRYLRRFRSIKKIVYFIKVYCLHEERISNDHHYA